MTIFLSYQYGIQTIIQDFHGRSEGDTENAQLGDQQAVCEQAISHDDGRRIIFGKILSFLLRYYVLKD